MKNLKYLLGFLLLGTQFSFAQVTKVNELVIKNPLEDNISQRKLVIDSITGKVGYTTLGGGGGSPQNLQGVLNTGNYAESPDGNSYISLLDSNPSGYENSLYVANEDYSNYSFLSMSKNNSSIGATQGIQSGFINFSGGSLLLRDSTDPSLTSVRFAPSLGISGETHIDFPAKAPRDDHYTLATTDDIFLNKVDGFNAYNRELRTTDETKQINVIFSSDDTFGSQFLIENNVGLEEEQKGFAIRSNEGVGSIIWNIGLDGASILDFNEPLANTGITHYNMPTAKVGDMNTTYTLATTDNITLQQAIANSGYATSGTSTVNILEGGTGYEEFSTYMENGLTGSSKTFGSIYNGNAGTILQAKQGDPDVVGTETRVTISLTDFQVQVAKNGNKSLLSFEEPIYNAGAQIYIPSLPTARHYKVSVAEVFTSDSTSPLSSGQLNTEYPFAQRGDKVHAMNISGGAKIYEYTNTGWVEYAVTVVP